MADIRINGLPSEASPSASDVVPIDGTTTRKATLTAVVTAGLANDVVTTAKILNANVTTAKIADAAVTTAKIADANVTTDKIADANVTAGKLATDSVTTAKIVDANVTTAKIADSNVTTAKIADLNVTTGKLADAAVTTAKITDANVTAAKLATDAVETAKIKDAAVTLAKMADLAEARIIGRAAAAGTGVPTALTGTQATVILDAFTGDSGSGGVKGLVPAPGSGDAAAGKFLAADGTWKVGGGGGRELLTSARTYYVRTDGSDSNDGLANTSGGAFLTVQRAVDVVLGTLDFYGFNVTIQVADGTYTGTITANSPQVGAGTLEIRGNLTTPGNVVFNPASGQAVGANGFGCRLRVRGVRIQSSGSATLLQATFGGYVEAGTVEIGASSSQAIYADSQGAIRFIENWSVVGNSPSLFLIQGGGVVVNLFRTVTLVGSIAFASSFCTVNSTGVLLIYGCTFTGSATGVRFYVIANGVIDTGGGGASYLPGDVAGSELTGGRYV